MTCGFSSPTPRGCPPRPSGGTRGTRPKRAAGRALRPQLGFGSCIGGACVVAGEPGGLQQVECDRVQLRHQHPLRGSEPGGLGVGNTAECRTASSTGCRARSRCPSRLTCAARASTATASSVSRTPAHSPPGPRRPRREVRHRQGSDLDLDLDRRSGSLTCGFVRGIG